MPLLPQPVSLSAVGAGSLVARSREGRPSASRETPASSRGVQRPGIRRTLDQEKAPSCIQENIQVVKEFLPPPHGSLPITNTLSLH